MSWKSLKQQSLADALIVEHAALKELDDVEELVDWSRIEKKLETIHNKIAGQQAWPPLMMFKALILQAWYGLSDPQLEKQMARDLLFRRFVGISLSQSVPDHSTLWRFRNKPEVQALQTEFLSAEKTNQNQDTNSQYSRASVWYFEITPWYGTNQILR
jgi:IS5 family transposase